MLRLVKSDEHKAERVLLLGTGKDEELGDRTGVPAGLSDAQVPTYNSYDNAVLYNDFVVSSLIKDFAKTDPNAVIWNNWTTCKACSPASARSRR